MADALASFIGGVNYTEYSVVEYVTTRGAVRLVVVEKIERDIDQGKPGFFGYTANDGAEVWGYDYQITRVVSR